MTDRSVLHELVSLLDQFSAENWKLLASQFGGVPGGETPTGQVFVQEVQRKGRIPQLIAALRSLEIANTADWKAFLQQFPEEFGTEDSALEAWAGQPLPQGVELGIRQEQFALAKSWICAIRTDQGHVGTGFLVGERLVMTNHHVYLNAALSGRSFFTSFDHDGKKSWEKLSRYPFKPDPLACCAFNERQRLDYVILELTQRPTDRGGHFQLVSFDPGDQRHTPIHVLGHPAARDEHRHVVALPLTHTTGLLQDDNSDTCRLAYTSGTASGSSGSVILLESGELIGLHHRGEKQRNRHGIPMWAILEDLLQQGRLDLVQVSGVEEANRPLRMPQELSEAQRKQVQQIPMRLRQPVGSKVPDQATAVGPGKTPDQPQVEAIREYLKSVIGWAERLPKYFPATARMENIRVQVRVRSESAPESRTQELLDENRRREGQGRAYAYRYRQQEGEQQQVQPWDEVRAGIRRAIIVADPGMGKSWLLKWEARRLANVAIEQLNAAKPLDQLRLPVLLRLFELGAALHELEEHGQDAGLVSGIIQATAKGSGEQGVGVVASTDAIAVLRQALEEQRCTVLLDAWDEAVEHHTTLAARLGTFVQRYPQTQLLVTSRIVGRPREGSLWTLNKTTQQDREFELQPFGTEQQRQFVESFFEAQQVGAMLRQIADAPQLSGLVEIPLLLGFLCVYAANCTAPLSELRRNDLYAYVTENLLLGEWHTAEQLAVKTLHYSEIEQDQELLGGIAYQLLKRNRQQFTRSDLRKALRTVCQEQKRPLTEEAERQLLLRFIDKTGLIQRTGTPRTESLLFLHLTVQEYLAARHLLQHPQRRLRILRTHWDHPGWNEVWNLLVLELYGDYQATQKLEKMVQTVLASGHPFDEHLRRPFLTTLHWIFLSQLETATRYPACSQVEEWGLQQLRGGEFRQNQILDICTNTQGFLPQRIQSHLLDCLKDNSLSVRWSVVRALAAHAGSKPVQGQLLDCLTDEDLFVRTSVIEALGTQVGSDPVQARLLDMLKDEEGRVRVAVVRALSTQAWLEPIQSRLLQCLSDEEEGVRWAVVDALRPQARREPVQSRLLECLKDKNLRRFAVEALAPHAGSEPVQSRLLEFLEDGDGVVRVSVVEALAAHAGSELIQVRLLDRLKDEVLSIRQTAVRALEAHAGLELIQARFLDCLKDEGLRQAVINALADYAGSEPVQSRLLECLKENDAGLRKTVIEVLSAHAAREPVQSHLLQLLNDEDGYIRQAAARALAAQAGCEPIQSQLLNCLQDKDGDVRWGAVNALAAHAGSGPVQSRLLACLNDEDIRLSVVRALGTQVGSEPVRSQLLDCLADEDTLIRHAVVNAMTARAGDEPFQSRLLECTWDWDRSVRQSAVEALGPHAGHERIQFRLLENLMDCSEDFRVRRAAMEALVTFGEREPVQSGLLECLQREGEDQGFRELVFQALSTAIIRERHELE